MINRRIHILMFFALAFPSLAFTETVKCKNTDGTISYSDSQCPSGSTSQKTVSNIPLGAEIGNSKQNNNAWPKMSNESCMQENQSAAKRCGEISVEIAKQCMRERLSSQCIKQYEAGSKAIQSADQGCKQEIQTAAMPCTQIQISKGRQCIQDQLSSSCKDETNKFNADFEKSRKQCEGVMLRLRESCAGTNEAVVQCMQKHQTEIKAACNMFGK